jgi:hypothetical protein
MKRFLPLILLFFSCSEKKDILVNAPPVAVSEGEVYGRAGDFIYLDGTGSYDPDGDRIFYSWKIVEAPEDSEAILGNSSEPVAVLYADIPGEYKISFTVSDGIETSNEVMIRVLAGNDFLLPVAVVNQKELSVNIKEEASVSGLLSFNPEGGELNYSWELKDLPSSSTGYVIDATSPVFRFIPDVPHGRYSAVLKVSNKYGESATDFVRFYVINRPPKARIEGLVLNTTYSGMSLPVDDNQTVEFGRYSSVSDDDNDTLSYNWTFTYTHKRGTFPSGHGFMCPSLGAGVFNYCPDPPDKVSFLDGISPDGEGSYLIKVDISDGYTVINKFVYLERRGAPPPSIRIDDKTVNHRFKDGVYYAEDRTNGTLYISSSAELKNLYTSSISVDWRVDVEGLPSKEAPNPVISPSSGSLSINAGASIQVPLKITISTSKPTILGDYRFRFTACLQGTSSCSADVFKITVVNLPPSSLSVPSQLVFNHSSCDDITVNGEILAVFGMPPASYNFSFSASDPDGDPLTFEFMHGNSTIPNLIYVDGNYVPYQFSGPSGANFSKSVLLCGLPWSCNFNWTWYDSLKNGKFTALLVSVKDPWKYGPSAVSKLYSLCP